MENKLLGEPDARQHANNLRLLAALPHGASIEKRERIVDYDIVELAALLREGNPEKLTSEQLFMAYWNRILQFNGPEETYGNNGKYNAFVRLEDFSTLLKQAILADQWLTTPDDERGPAPPLCGIPFGIKDSFALQGLESKNGTQAFSGNLALRDATCVARLRAQGAIIIGHTICSELSTHTVGQFAGNAWDPTRTPGGSSQGSGVAPVARLCAAALGEETAGSIIIPAAANGASAIKPSLGLVSGAGVMPLRSGWDVVGPIDRRAALHYPYPRLCSSGRADHRHSADGLDVFARPTTCAVLRSGLRRCLHQVQRSACSAGCQGHRLSLAGC
ncbi:putative amidase [Pseudomonas amygdali pv. myricae]|uniref:amidase family protein n=1 Tax=Pseudomonas amygdali TaxID=47877 RepID=UPI0006CDB661|nr:amidase [Pseudomonas amygdali]KPB53733.1 Amidase [Pseudomonas amygdali pv. myricae]KPX90549.1 putative amidase [Pseudomonas amygdali pv. myricae]RMT48018.1 putative amidase [Pseudomonas amygdali pv. myricae]RMV05911.1 putative amidase [Pseudomonas amygdali pv. myricae]RMV30521.1 putative amidase [Pseudomonas amygdali pv. myricae]